MMSERVSLHLLHVAETLLATVLSLLEKEPMLGGCRTPQRGKSEGEANHDSV